MPRHKQQNEKNREFSLKFPVGHPDRQASEEGQRVQQLKRDNDNKHENISQNINDANNDSSFLKFKTKLIFFY